MVDAIIEIVFSFLKFQRKEDTGKGNVYNIYNPTNVILSPENSKTRIDGNDRDDIEQNEALIKKLRLTIVCLLVVLLIGGAGFIVRYVGAKNESRPAVITEDNGKGQNGRPSEKNGKELDYDHNDLKVVEALGLDPRSKDVKWNKEGRVVWIDIPREIENIDLRNCMALERLELNGGLVVKVDVTGCAGLKELWGNHCDDLGTIVGLSSCVSLRGIGVRNSSVSSLDLRACSKLNYLEFDQELKYVLVANTLDPEIVIHTTTELDVSAIDASGKSVELDYHKEQDVHRMKWSSALPIVVSYSEDGEVVRTTTFSMDPAF